MRVLKASGFFVATVFFVLTINFFALSSLPGDPLLLMFGDLEMPNSPAFLQELEAIFGLDKPPLHRFIYYLQKIFTGDLGFSQSQGAPVIKVIAQIFPWTLFLGTATIVIALPLAIFLANEAALKEGQLLDKSLLSISLTIQAIPSFILAMLILFVFAISLQWLPFSGAKSPFVELGFWQKIVDIIWHLIAPLSVLLLEETSKTFYELRSGALVITRRAFMEVADLKGVKGIDLRYKYLFLNNLPLIIAHSSKSFGHLIGGIIFVEMVFGYPGIGQAIWRAIAERDYPLIQGAILVLAVFILTLNFVADLLIERFATKG